MRVVLDNNIVVSAWLWDGKPLRLLQAGHQQRIQLYTSAALLTELTNALGRPKFAPRIATTGMPIDRLIDGYVEFAIHVIPESVLRVARDPDDDHVLACTVAAQADVIVSGDRDLLILQSYQDIDILTPTQAIERIEQEMP